MLGIFSKTLDSNFVEAAGLAELDFIILDQEHGPTTIDILQNHVRAAKCSGMKSFIRVPANTPHSIGAALDTGADGILVPNISCFDEAQMAVKAARFYPQGMRGMCRFVNAAEYGLKDKEAYFAEANEKTIVLQLEGIDGLKDLDKILSIESFDVLFIGPYDLSQSAGYPGQINHPEVVALIEQISEKVKQSGKVLGTFAETIKSAQRLIVNGFSFLAYSVDVTLFAEKINEIKKQIQ